MSNTELLYNSIDAFSTFHVPNCNDNNCYCYYMKSIVTKIKKHQEDKSEEDLAITCKEEREALKLLVVNKCICDTCHNINVIINVLE